MYMYLLFFFKSFFLWGGGGGGVLKQIVAKEGHQACRRRPRGCQAARGDGRFFAPVLSFFDPKP